MEAAKRKLLEQTHQTILKVGFEDNDYELVADLISTNFVAFGTAIDEKIFGIKDLKALLKRQKEQSKGIDINVQINTLHTHLSKNENTAVYIDEGVLSITTDEEPIEMILRLSLVLEYIEDKWLMVHFHSSKPEEVESEKDTWGIETWKERAEALEKEVAERTADLVLKNRDLEIEAALERVRARSMAMHSSDELNQVVAVLFENLKELQIPVTAAGIQIYLEDSEDMLNYVCGENSEGLVISHYRMPYFDNAIINDFKNARDSEEGFFVGNYSKKIKDSFYNYLFDNTEIKDVPEDIKKMIFDSRAYTISMAPVSNSLIAINDFQGNELSKNHTAIIQRFANVFEQAYIRFRDLQKAEAQAREAQIQLSLERVRAKSMAMQSSDELHDVIGIVFQQFDNLKIQPVNVFLSLFDREKRMLTYRASGKSGNRMPTKQTVDIDSVEAWSDLYNKWINDSSDDIEVIYYPKEIVPDILNLLKDTFLAMPKRDRMTVKDFPEGGYSTLGYTPFGYIGYDHTRPPTEEEKDILKRICTEFGRVYQRFLDLKKAEAQARESKIEMTLERVRSRSMGMQKSEELEEIIQVVFDQFIQLGITVDHSGFIMDYKSRDDMHIWLADEHKITSQITLPYFDSPHWNSFNEAKKKGDNLFLNHLNFKEKNKFYKQIFKYVPDLPEDAKTFYLQCPSLTIATTLADNIGLYIENYSGIQYSEEDQKTLIRFGKVFQQTYTRFLDLTKAEAQAREAQIEAALEKVRSRTMAMQKSEELPLAANNLFLQVQELGIPAWSAGYCIWQDDKHNASCNMSSEGEIQKGFILPSIGEGYDFYNPQKKGETFYVKELCGEALVKHYEFMKELPNVGEILKELTNAGLELPTFQIFHICYFKYGYVMFITYEEVPHAHNVFKRFSQVFEQTYTRFLDLERAEAQAKEAHIEMALEKVRSRTMAMQKGEELKEVVVLLYKELIKLGVTNFVSCGYVEINEVTHRQLTWVTDPGGDSLDLFYLPLTGDATFDERYNAWKKQQEIFHQTVAGKKRKKHFEYAITTFNSKEAEEMVLSQFPDPTVFYCFNFPQGYLHIVSGSRLNKDEEMLLARFTRVFEQTYTRFLDLERAEEQAREAKIEMALEKVRSRTMAMQQSYELKDAAQVLFTEVQNLGIPTWSCGYNILSNDKKSAECWMSSEGQYMQPFTLYYEKEKSLVEQYDFFKSKNEFFVQEQYGKDLEDTYAYMKTIPEIGEIIVDLEQSGISLPTHQFNHLCKFNKGYLLFITYEPVPEAHELFVRFTKVFDQTYTRFLDLKDAEARARESKIQAALERVRSRSMGMQTTADFGEVTTEMFNQLRGFGEDLFATGIVFCDKHKGHVEQWHSIPGGGMLSPMIVPIDLDYIHQYRYDQWKAGKELFSIEIPSDFIEQHFEDIFKLPSAQITLKDLEARNAPMPAAPDWEIDYGASFNHGYILISSLKPLENTDILPRFAKVFEQAYTRFLDLQKAEEQAREAKIEASLERVRAKTMAMHKSEDLSEVATVLFEQISLLTETPSRFNIAILNEEEQLFDIWVTDQKGHNLNKLFVFDVQKSEIVAEVYKAFQAKEKHIIQHMSGERLENWIEYASKEAGVPFDKEDIKEDRYINSIFFKHGCIGITTDEIPDESVIQLLERFTKVFEQTFTRFLDLEKAEAQAREAKIEAALEKVRSRSLAMHQSTEMQKVVNEIQEQVRSLGLKIDALAMSGVIDNESDYDVWVGGANSQKPLRIPYNNDTKIQRDFNKAIKERPDLFTKTYTGKVMKDYFKALIGTGNSFNPEIEQFMLTCTGFTTTLTFMKNSGIQIIRYTEESFSDTDNAIVIRFGKVFEQAYIRFLDLQKAEGQTLLAEQNLIQLKTEKKRAEEALSELQQTQNQLIQSEKMASLGELTAGIAHEIQNPLNFVNNFSEVSKELLEEMQEEIENGDFEEVKAIMEDVIQNLEKINHHGKRADGIVKGMLQHSRSSTGTKEPTDINALADEYLRLAYHGLRAKDKSFNAELVTDFDDSIGDINVIPQDMGRVILNLITNAFYASNERKKASKDQGFKPIVSVSTKKIGDHLEIKVTDNGNGIPKEVVDKIFQPFFTTKPTGQGTGLGLSMSYDIVTKGHGGELKVETKGGIGTKFIIVLPILADQ